MIRSIFRLMWRRKKSSFLMTLEIFISLLLLFALSTMVVNNINRYNEPLGFDYENVWVMEMNLRGGSHDGAGNKQLFDLLVNNIKSIPEVLEISNCSSNFPYDQSTRMTTLYNEGFRIGNADIISTDVNYVRTLNLRISEGRWYNAEDHVKNETPVVINRKLREKLFGNNPAIGKVFHSEKYVVVGVVDHFKIKGEFSEKPLMIFEMIKPERFQSTLMIRTNSAAGLAFEEQLYKLASSTAREWTIKLGKLAEYRSTSFRITWVPIVIFSSICGFLIINIILGLFGILLYNINNRKHEIGLRRSAGANKGNIYFQFMGEMLVLTTMGIAPGILIAVQFLLLKAFGIEPKIFLIAIIGSVLVIYFLVLISSFIPSRYASKIQPAVALHDK
ncbi:MAG: ABC transporter permease [Cytophagales bacterium]|nr:ABC transporter permease [Cytophagales bacterium]